MPFKLSPKLVEALRQGQDLILTFNVPNQVVEDFPHEVMMLKEDMDNVYKEFMRDVEARKKRGEEKWFTGSDKLLLVTEQARKKEEEGYK